MSLHSNGFPSKTCSYIQAPDSTFVTLSLQSNLSFSHPGYPIYPIWKSDYNKLFRIILSQPSKVGIFFPLKPQVANIHSFIHSFISVRHHAWSLAISAWGIWPPSKDKMVGESDLPFLPHILLFFEGRMGEAVNLLSRCVQLTYSSCEMPLIGAPLELGYT